MKRLRIHRADALALIAVTFVAVLIAFGSRFEVIRYFFSWPAGGTWSNTIAWLEDDSVALAAVWYLRGHVGRQLAGWWHQHRQAGMSEHITEVRNHVTEEIAQLESRLHRALDEHHSRIAVTVAAAASHLPDDGKEGPALPYSDTSLRPWILSQLLLHGAEQAQLVVDVGCGDGSAVKFYKPHFPESRWHGIEIWEPYVARFELSQLYDELDITDAMQAQLPSCDIMIFGDILEHLPVPDAICLWNRGLQVAKLLVLGIPVIHLPQGEWEGNPHEAHLADWDATSVMRSFSGITSWTQNETVGAFIAAGRR